MPFVNKFGSFPPCECGLVVAVEDNWREQYAPVPLKQVDADAEIVDFVADVRLVQTFSNVEEKPLEAVYMFPLDEAACLVGFEAELDGRLIKSSVKEIETAKKEYEDAVQAGQTSFLVMENKPDIFKIKVGMLKPGASVVIRLRYLTELAVDGGAVRFYIPTTISPRYIPKTDVSEEAKDIGNMTFSALSPAPMTIKANINMKSKITTVESPTHAINVDLDGKRCTTTLEGMTTDMDRDFVLLIHTENSHQPRLCVEQLAGSVAASVSFVPEFQEKIRQKVELVFLIDRSGSMGGDSIALAKKALKIFLHSLPTDSYFNVVGFGSHVEFLFPSAVLYSENTFTKAVKHAEELDANLGGTEIYNPLKTILTQPSIEGYIRQVLVLTDGEVSNTSEVIGLVHKHSNKARVFALGIGDGASHFLVEGMARAGRGTADFATYKEKLEPKVQKQLSHCLQPALTNVEILWDGDGVGSEKSIRSPHAVPPIFNRFRLLSYCIWDSICLPTRVSVKALNSNGDPVVYTVDRQDIDVFQGDILHKLAARKLIQDFEEGTSHLHVGNEVPLEQVKKEVVTVALKYGLASKYTAFIAVDEKTDGSTAACGMQTRHVPNQLTHGWGGRSRKLLCAQAMPCAMACMPAAPMAASALQSYAVPENLILCGLKRSKKKKTEQSDYIVDDEVAVEENETLPAESRSVLERLLELQKFDGSFAVDSRLANVISVKWDDILSECGSFAQDVWVTAVALKFLEFLLPDEKDTWELVAEKSQQWIEQKINGTGIPVLTQAEVFVKKYCITT